MMKSYFRISLHRTQSAHRRVSATEVPLPRPRAPRPALRWPLAPGEPLRVSDVFPTNIKLISKLSFHVSFLALIVDIDVQDTYLGLSIFINRLRRDFWC